MFFTLVDLATLVTLVTLMTLVMLVTLGDVVDIGGVGEADDAGDDDDDVFQVDAPLSDTLLEAEVLANVLTDPAILASGVFFDVQQFTSSDGT